MVRTNWGGSILGFALIGGIMALLLVGGVYVVRHALMPVAGGDSVATQDDSDTAPQSEEDENPADEGARENEQRDSETPPAHESTGESRPEPGNLSPNALPETGIGSSILSGLLLGGIAAAVVAYKRSRDLPASL